VKTILFVDDDIRVVSALQRALHKTYEIEIAGCASEGLEAVRESSYAVVVSDMKMPGMSGIEFLARVKEISPETVRILLTGQADLDVAIAAVNEGNVFRFLSKPCPQDLLSRTLDAALEQYRMCLAEKDVLRETLMGTVTVLVEILGAIQPLAFGRAARLRRCVRALAIELNAGELWQFEAAAMLSQIGCISVRPEVLEKYYAGEDLSGEELNELHAHAQFGRRLLQGIPRLSSVSRMIERQHETYAVPAGLPAEEHSIALGSQMLRVALDFDRLRRTGAGAATALIHMREDESEYNPDVLTALERVHAEAGETDLVTEECLAPETAPSDHQLFRPVAEQVLRALRT
jgi:response regulator RpfG family c-di-GMP phosphodiesterase